MSSRKGKVARDREEKVAGDRESNREEKRGKNREKTKRREFYMLWKGEKQRVQQRREKRKKSREEIERKEFYMLWKCGQWQTYQSSVAMRENSGKKKCKKKPKRIGKYYLMLVDCRQPQAHSPPNSRRRQNTFALMLVDCLLCFESWVVPKTSLFYLLFYAFFILIYLI